jgi:hypothetical protein
MESTNMNRLMMGSEAPEMDIETRTLKKVCFASRRLATDGIIIEMSGMDISRFAQTPVVTAGHDMAYMGSPAPVVARATAITKDENEAFSPVQFAETDKGKEYAYLYGLNPKKEVFMRAFSLEGSVMAYRTVGFLDARVLLGSLWDDQTADLLQSRGYTSLRVADRFLLKSFAAVPVGADRGALSRAFSDGVKAAGEIVTGMDLAEIRTALESVRKELCLSELDRIALQIQALARDGADAASRGDSSALLMEIRKLTEEVKQR